jgi:hypothetical protein
VFLALNRVVVERWEANGRTNDGRRISHPVGASTFFQDLHTTVLVFRRYETERITTYTPTTSRNFRQTYLP